MFSGRQHVFRKLRKIGLKKQNKVGHILMEREHIVGAQASELHQSMAFNFLDETWMCKVCPD